MKRNKITYLSDWKLDRPDDCATTLRQIAAEYREEAARIRAEIDAAHNRVAPLEVVPWQPK